MLHERQKTMQTLVVGNTRTGKGEWLTPPEIIHALGKFDLDPCAPVNRPWPMAANHFTIEQDGLKQQWFGRVWCNPPYDPPSMAAFVRRCVEHRNATLLTFARTETKVFQELIFPNVVAMLFIAGRLRFYHATGEQAGTAGAPSVLAAFDEANAAMLAQSGIRGKYIRFSR